MTRDFPAVLRTIPDPPPVLFARGRLDLLERPALAIVGSRDHSAYGATVARIGRRACRARRARRRERHGSRSRCRRARRGARRGGTTIGVLGNGLGVIYPAANRALYERVLAEGLSAQRVPARASARTPAAFPRRNRLISGLARATLVVEAAVGSGALITAGTALDQGRDVMAVPGPITSPLSTGCNRLLRDGATPYLEPADLASSIPRPRSRRSRPVRPQGRRGCRTR